MTVPAGLAARIVRIDREIVQALRDAGALSVATAATLQENHFLHQRRLTHLREAGVVLPAGERFFLDESAWEAYRRRRRLRVTVGLAIAFIAIAIGFYLTWITIR